MNISDLPTPSILINVEALQRNIDRMQNICDLNSVELWPHIKTHKCGEIVKLQLKRGARGITCAKLGEAEALLPTGVRQIFIAHSLVDPRMRDRVRHLYDRLDRLVLAVTSLEQLRFVEALVLAAGIKCQVLVAYDTGLGREGARSLEDLKSIFEALDKSRCLEPLGIYTHEGHCYAASESQLNAVIDKVHRLLVEASESMGSPCLVAPGCTASAATMAQKKGVDIVRPGAYVLGDLSTVYERKLMKWEDAACTVLSTVVDKPEPGLALLDAGSKTFSGDKTLGGESGRALHDPKVKVARVNEEHGYLRDFEEADLSIGDRLRFVPAHVCTTMNMGDIVYAISGDEVVSEWLIDARGKVN